MYLTSSTEYLHIIIVRLRPIFIANSEIASVTIPTRINTNIWLFTLIAIADIFPTFGAFL